jgi:hypothetical protein
MKTKSTGSRLRLPLLIIFAVVFVVGLLPSNASAAGTITGLYEIKNTLTRRCLTVNGGYSNNVEPMVQYTCGGWEYQKFQFKTTYASGWFTIHPKSKPWMCLGIAFDYYAPNNSLLDGVPLQQQTCAKDAAGDPLGWQMFKLQWVKTFSDGNTMNKIINGYAAKCLQVNGPSYDNYAPITQWNCASPNTPPYYKQHFNWDFKWLAHS